MATVPCYLLDRFVLDGYQWTTSPPSVYYNPPFGSAEALAFSEYADLEQIGRYVYSPYPNNTFAAYTNDSITANYGGSSGGGASAGSVSAITGSIPSSYTSSGTSHAIEVEHYARSAQFQFEIRFDAAHKSFGYIYTPTVGCGTIARDGSEYTLTVTGRVGGCADSFTVTPATPPINGSSAVTGYEWFDTTLHIDWGDGDADDYALTPDTNGAYSVDAVHEYATFDHAPIQLYADDVNGQESYVLTQKVPPVASLSLVSADDDIFIYDAGGSFDVDGAIVDFELKSSVTALPLFSSNGSYDSGTGFVTWDFQSTGETISANANRVLRMTVTDEDGTRDQSDVTVTITPLSLRTDSADLPSRAVYVFYKSGADLKLAFYPNGSASRSVVATFTGCKSPSFWVKSDSSFRAAMDNGTSYILKSSYDRGATWSSSLATIWNSTNYYKAASCGLKTGGMASVAVKRGTSPAEVYVKVSNDETNWVSDASATLVDTTTSTATQFSIRQKNESGSNAIIISNGTDEIWQSVNGGSTWTPI